MTTYRVTTREVLFSDYEIEADSPEAAEKALDAYPSPEPTQQEPNEFEIVSVTEIGNEEPA